MSINTDILLSAGDLEIGQSQRIACPACGQRTCSLTRTDMGVLYQCHRASCALSGFAPTAGSLVQGEQPKRNEELKPYTGSLARLTSADRDYFRERYELPGAERYILRGNLERYALPIEGPDGLGRGFTLRTPWPGSPLVSSYGGPKAVVYMHSHAPAAAFYRSRDWTAGPVVLVEDQLSAMKAAQSGAVGWAVALLGVGGSTRMGSLSGGNVVRDIASLHPERVIVAFDADATATAFKWARKWGLAFNKTRVAVLERDLKDTPLRDIGDALGVT